MKKIIILFLFFIFSQGISFAQQPDFSIVGFATENGGTTGGASGTEVYVTNYTDLKSYAESTTAYIIHVSGTINAGADGGSIRPKSNKTIIGEGNTALLWGVGFTISGYNNIIIRNLRISMQGVTTRVDKSGVYSSTGDEGRPQILTNAGDCICIQGTSKNIWIDHCEFFSEDPYVQTNQDLYDGLVDVKNGSQYITISWCYFHDHHKCHLIGSSDTDVGDRKITFHHNYYSHLKQRLPLYRFGTAHIFNNYFLNCVDAINSRMEACVYVEKNYFENVTGNTIYSKDSQLPGYATYVDNVFVNSKAQSAATCSSFTPSYVYSNVLTTTTANVPNVVVTYSGVGKLGNQAPIISITSPLNNATVVASANISISATATDADGAISKVEFYNGTTLLGTNNSSPYTYAWNGVGAGTYSLIAKATDDKGAVSSSSPIVIIVLSATIPTLNGTNVNQTISPSSSIQSMVFTWGNAATDVTYTALPNGLTAVKNATAKTLTISGSPTVSGTFIVTSVGGSPSVNLNASVSINTNMVLANWYPFQETPISLPFVSYVNASLNYLQDNSAYSATGCTNGAVTLTKGTGELLIDVVTLETLKLRWYATGGRTLQVVYGPTGTENTWNSPIQYSSGAYEHDLTSLISGLSMYSSPIKVRIINNRTDGGSLHITDLYVKGSLPNSSIKTQTIALQVGWNLISLNVSPTDKTIESIFSSVIANVIEVKDADGFWRKGQNASLQSLKNFSNGKAYLVKMQNAGSISVTGSPVLESLPSTNLKVGWNLIACPYQTSTAISPVIATKPITIIKNFDGFWQSTGTPSITSFDPGKGYYFNVSSPTTITW